MISILIPLRNEYENLDEIERIFKDNLSLIKHEVILVNDYSTDNTLNKAKEIAEKNKNFVVSKDNKSMIIPSNGSFIDSVIRCKVLLTKNGITEFILSNLPFQSSPIMNISAL